jgi:HEAT repeat protein
VLEAAEEMNAPEVASLGRFLHTKSDALEPQLVKAVEDNIGPSATLVAARALAAERTQTAIPVLMEAYLDEDRGANKDAMARALAKYGKKLVPPVTRELKKRGSNPLIVTLLMELERSEPGLLDELAKDRSKSVREATQAARDRMR